MKQCVKNIMTQIPQACICTKISPDSNVWFSVSSTEIIDGSLTDAVFMVKHWNNDYK